MRDKFSMNFGHELVQKYGVYCILAANEPRVSEIIICISIYLHMGLCFLRMYIMK